MSGTLRYVGLGIYGAITAGIILLKTIPLTTEIVIALLAPIALVITVDIYKHRDDKPV